MLGTSLLEDVEIVTMNNREKVIDLRELDRQSHVQGGTKILIFPLAETVYRDGKRGTILEIEKIGSKSHISILEEPGSQCFGNFTPQTGSVRTISDGIINFFK